MIPRFGRPALGGMHYRHRPGAYAILLRGPRILVTVQATEAGGEVQLPGGGIDAGESTRPALLREILEETGHSARIVRRLSAFREFTWMPDYGIHAEKLCHVYLGHPGRRLGPPREPGHSALWLDPGEALSRLVSPGSRSILARLLSGGPPGLAPRAPVRRPRDACRRR